MKICHPPRPRLVHILLLKLNLNKDQLDDILKSINDLSGRMQLMLEDMKQNKQDLEEIRKKKSELLKSI